MTPKTNLYEELRKLGRYPIQVRREYENHNQRVSESNKIFLDYQRELGTRVLELLKIEIPEIDTTEIEIALFRKYSDNPVLGRAIKDVQSVESRLSELEKDWNGFRKYIPRRKDAKYEEARRELAELIPIDHLRKRGVVVWDNPVSIAIQTAVISGILYNMVDSFGFNHANTACLKGMALGLNLIPIAFAPVYLRFRGILKGPDTTNYEDSRNAARYLDDKIKQLIQ